MTVKVHPTEPRADKRAVGSDHASADAQSVRSEDDDGEEYVYSTFCWGLCCFRGCVIATIGVIYFILIIPTGIVLIIMGARDGLTIHLGVGVGVMLLTVVATPSAYLIYTQCSRRLCGKDAEKRDPEPSLNKF